LFSAKLSYKGNTCFIVWFARHHANSTNLVIISEKPLLPEIQIQSNTETIHYFYLWGKTVAAFSRSCE